MQGLLAQNTYYLNHVGYKVLLSAKDVGKCVLYYLNHVGYKEKCSTNIGTNTSRRII